MTRPFLARTALAMTVLLVLAAVAGFVWTAQYPYHDITETYVQMLSAVAATAAIFSFAVLALPPISAAHDGFDLTDSNQPCTGVVRTDTA